MRRFITVTAGLLAAMCWLVTPGFSATERSYSGRIVMVDPKLRILIVKGAKGEETFCAAPKSTFMIDGEPKLFSQLRKGEDVTVTLKESAATTAAQAGSH